LARVLIAPLVHKPLAASVQGWKTALSDQTDAEFQGLWSGYAAALQGVEFLKRALVSMTP
ncbi:hypothetical protein, partial [Corynebacterium glutamicum]